MAKIGPKMFHVAFSSKKCVEGFITDDPRDANWTATGKPASNCVPTIGYGIRELLDNPKAILPRKWAVVFDTEEEAFSAMQAAKKEPRP